jgi:hypothetical protein
MTGKSMRSAMNRNTARDQKIARGATMAIGLMAGATTAFIFGNAVGAMIYMIVIMHAMMRTF